jgi:DtxR family manganese transport transcriptional regulator
LLALGVSKSVAESDSEGIEHHVSNQTLLAMKRFSESQKDRP